MARDSIYNGEQIDFLKENFSEEFNHIYRELKNINIYLEERIYKNVQKDMNLETDNKNLEEAERLLKAWGEVKSLNESLENIMEIALRFKKDINELEEEIQFNDEKRKYSKRNTPQYDRVQSDTKIPHSIDEDFTYKKPCGFMFRGKVYEAYSMRDILIKNM